jgi:hypothetical protein
MARSFNTIKTEIQTAVRTYPSLDDFKFPSEGGSSVGVFNLLITIMASSILVFEVILDLFKDEVEGLALSAVSCNAKWLQGQILGFQYGDTIIIGDDYVPYYAVPDDTKKIVTRCAIVEGTWVTIKVAKGAVGSLAALTTTELNALKDYYFGTSFSQGIGIAGITPAFVSLAPDRMKITANVYYTPQSNPATVKTAVIAAIDGFFAEYQDIYFDGTIFMISVTDAVQAVSGVTQIVYTAIEGRDSATAVGSGTSVDVQGSYAPVAGYVISEDTASHTLSDTLTMIPQG